MNKKLNANSFHETWTNTHVHPQNNRRTDGQNNSENENGKENNERILWILKYAATALHDIQRFKAYRLDEYFFLEKLCKTTKPPNTLTDFKAKNVDSFLISAIEMVTNDTH